MCAMGVKVDPEKDHIKVDGRHLKPPAPKAYVMLNKPKDVLTTLARSETDDRLTIERFLRGINRRVFPVGRLDYDTEGLLLLTNDGELGERLLHPRYHVPKTYLTKIKGALQEEEIRQLETGVRLQEGITAPSYVKKIRKVQENSWIELTIFEGRIEVLDEPRARALAVRRDGAGHFGDRAAVAGHGFKELDDACLAFALEHAVDRALAMFQNGRRR